MSKNKACPSYLQNISRHKNGKQFGCCKVDFAAAFVHRAATQFCSCHFGTVAADTTLDAVASLVEATGNEW